MWRSIHVPVHVSSSSCTQHAQHERDRERERNWHVYCSAYVFLHPRLTVFNTTEQKWLNTPELEYYVYIS